MANGVFNSGDLAAFTRRAGAIRFMGLRNPILFHGLYREVFPTNLQYIEALVTAKPRGSKLLTLDNRTTGTTRAYNTTTTFEGDNTTRTFETFVVQPKEVWETTIPLRHEYAYPKIEEDLRLYRETMALASTVHSIDLLKPKTAVLNSDRVIYSTGNTNPATGFHSNATGTIRDLTFDDFRRLGELCDKQRVPQTGDSANSTRVILMSRYFYNRLSTIDEITSYRLDGLSGLYNQPRYRYINNFLIIPIEVDVVYNHTALTTLSDRATQYEYTTGDTDVSFQAGAITPACIVLNPQEIGFGISAPEEMQVNFPEHMSIKRNSAFRIVVGDLGARPSTFVIAGSRF